MLGTPGICIKPGNVLRAVATTLYFAPEVYKAVKNVATSLKDGLVGSIFP